MFSLRVHYTPLIVVVRGLKVKLLLTIKTNSSSNSSVIVIVVVIKIVIVMHRNIMERMKSMKIIKSIKNRSKTISIQPIRK